MGAHISQQLYMLRGPVTLHWRVTRSSLQATYCTTSCRTWRVVCPWTLSATRIMWTNLSPCMPLLPVGLPELPAVTSLFLICIENLLELQWQRHGNPEQMSSEHARHVFCGLSVLTFGTSSTSLRRCMLLLASEELSLDVVSRSLRRLDIVQFL